MRRDCRERFPRHRRQRKPLVSDPGMHHGTCVKHVPWCMPGSLTRGGGEMFPSFPAHAQPAILRIWQAAHVSERVPSYWYILRLLQMIRWINIMLFKNFTTITPIDRRRPRNPVKPLCKLPSSLWTAYSTVFKLTCDGQWTTAFFWHNIIT